VHTFNNELEKDQSPHSIRRIMIHITPKS